MVTKKDLESMSDGQIVETVAVIKSYDVKVAKNDKKYLDGLVEAKGTIQFKVWAGTLFDEMNSCDYGDTKCSIRGKVNEFNGTKSLVLTDVKALAEKGEYDPEDFFETKYNISAYWGELCNLVSKRASQQGYTVFEKVMSDIVERFKVEFAARSHHDAVMGGLLAHTYKVTSIMARVLKLYPTLTEKVDTDLLIVGSALHDIGKVFEYTNGSIIGNGLLVSHHTFGVEIVTVWKDEIIELKSEEFYYRLLAIIEQHHGEYEETPRTIEAYLVHMADLIESKYQAISESLESGDGIVNIDSFKLR